MSANLENNKIFAAILCALLTVMLSGFFANLIFYQEPLKEDAVHIDGAEAGAHGGAVDAGPKLPDPIMAMLATADAEKGAKISKACAACHSFDKGGPTKQGPNLYGVVGGPKAHVAGFAYSDGVKTKGGTWDYDSLNHFLEKPKKYISDTKMNFAGLKKASDRAALIAWLRQQSDAPYALPSDADIAKEEAAFAPKEEEAAAEGEEAPAEPSHH